MLQLWLRYQRGATIVARQFDALSAPQKPDVELKTARTLRGTDIAHRLSDRETWTITVGANALYQTDARDFMLALWKSDRVWISFQIAPKPVYEDDYIECTRPGGTCPLEFVEGNERLPSITMQLTQKYKNP